MLRGEESVKKAGIEKEGKKKNVREREREQKRGRRGGKMKGVVNESS